MDMDFSIVKKGYNPVEVDAYIEDLETKYLRLQAQNTELEQKLATAKRLIRRFSDTENALKQNIADSKRAAAYMISDARDRSSDLLESARESCGEIISELDIEISRRMNTVELMKAEVNSFKDALFSLYAAHIEMIDTIAEAAEEQEFEPDYTKIADAVDTFEEAGEPDCVVPEFVEYPEESIFSEMEESEQTEGFVIDKGVTLTDSGEIVFETVEEDEENESFSQLYLENEEQPEPEIGEEEMSFDFAEPADEIDDDPEEELQLNDHEIKNVESQDISESDYFKFLSDFANSDEGEL